MPEEFPVIVRPGAEWDDRSRNAARDLILASKAVSNRPALETNLKNARQLAMIHHQGQLIATATIKVPQPSYRKRVSDSSGIDVTYIDVEFGYVAVEEKFWKHHLGTALADRLLDDIDVPIFATTGHPAMKKIFPRKHFVEKGATWTGGTKDEPVTLSLFIRL